MIHTAGSRLRAGVIVNAAAGRVGDAAPTQELKCHFAAHGVEASIHLARRGAVWATWPRRVVNMDPDTLVAGGATEL